MKNKDLFKSNKINGEVDPVIFSNHFQDVFNSDMDEQTVSIQSIIRNYNVSSPEVRARINNIFVCLCGWQLTSLIEQIRGE